MSNVSTIHDIQSFTAKSAPLSGQRLIKASFKTPKDGTAKRDSKCASIPFLELALNDSELELLVPHIQRMLENAQDGIFRDAVENDAATISDGQLSFHACLQFLSEEAAGNRITKDFLNAWFAENVEDSLTVLIADKMNVSDSPSDGEKKRIEQQLNVYRDKIASLSSGRTQFTPDVAKNVLKVLSICEIQKTDSTYQKLKVRLDKMIAAPQDFADGLLNL